MSVSLQYLERCAGETGFAAATLEKVTRLGELAGEIARHPLLGKSLALKGGTALNLCFGDAPTRMSVDLDYNYIAHADRHQMLADRPQVEAALEELARRMGYRLQRSRDEFAGRTLFAIYRSVFGTDERVEVDVNYLFRMPLQGLVQASLWQPGELDRPQVGLVSLVELCVGKLMALLDRAAPRDAWDAVRLPAVAGRMLESPHFRALFVGMSAILSHPINTYTRERMKRQLTPAVMESHLAPMLVGGVLPDSEALLDEAWRVVAPFVQLSTAEYQYISGVQKGELRPELLLSSQPEMIALHPAVRWKIENVERHRRGRT